MSDLIDRQQAIDAIAQCTNCGDEDTLREYVLKHSLDNGWTGGVLEALDAVKNLPPAQPEPQWIPCSERMPEEHESMFAKYYNTPKWNNSMWLKESDKMLVSAEVPGNEIIVDTAKMIDGKWFFGLSFVDKKVIAWMPLPTPYTK